MEETLIAINGFHRTLIKIELSVAVLGCGPCLGRTRNSVEEATRGKGCAENSPTL